MFLCEISAIESDRFSYIRKRCHCADITPPLASVSHLPRSCRSSRLAAVCPRSHVQSQQGLSVWLGCKYSKVRVCGGEGRKNLLRI
jgi:hypothetical protein